MTRLIIYFFIAFVSFLVFLVVLAPAAPLWSFVDNSARQRVPDLNIFSVNGTVWDGKAELQYRKFPTSILSWDLDPLALPKMQIESNLALRGDAHNFAAFVGANRTSLSVADLNGTLGSAYINRVSQAQGLTFSGDIDITDLNIQSDLKWIQSASGHISWPGGEIISHTDLDGTQVFELPDLQGDVSMVGQNLRMKIHHRNEALIIIELKPNGWIIVLVKARLFDLAALQGPNWSSLDDTVLEFEEKIF